MNNENRRRIINKAKAEGYQGSYVDLFKQAAQDPTLIAQTPEEKQAGLRPQHEAGRTDASMAFTDVPPNTPFNTVGMKAPINIKKYDEQGHLVKSYENVPPGLTNIDSGPRSGTVLESPARMQEGGLNPMTPKTFPSNAERAKNINYAKQIDMAGRLNAIGANTTNEELGLGAADRGKLPLVPNPQLEAAMSNKRIKAQEGALVESTSQPMSAAEMLFLNPPSEKLNLPATISQGNFDVDEDENIIEDQASILDMMANPMTTLSTVVDPSVKGRPSQVEFDKAKRKGTIAGQMANDLVNPAAWVNYGKNAVKDASQGNFMGAALNALGAIPGISITGAGTRQALKQAGVTGVKNLYKANPALKNPMGFRNVGDKPNFLFGYNKPIDPLKMDLSPEAGFKEFQENVSRNTWYWKNMDRIDAELYAKTPFDDELGAGAFGTVYSFRDSPYAIKFPHQEFSHPSAVLPTSRYSGTTDDFISRTREIADDMPNVAAPLRSQNDLTIMRNLQKQEAVPGAPELPTRDAYAAALKQVRQLRDKGIGLDLDNIKGNINYNTNTGKFDFYDLENVPQLSATSPRNLEQLNVRYGPIRPYSTSTSKKVRDRAGAYTNPVGYMEEVRSGLGVRGMGYPDKSTGRRSMEGVIRKRNKPASQRAHGGYTNKRIKAQEGTVVDYLLPALESNNPTQFADTQLSNQTENIKIQQDNLKAEEQRVQDVRNNVIPTAQNLAALNKDIKETGYFGYYGPHKRHFEKMRDPDTSPKEYKQLETEAKEKYPELIEAIPKNNVMMMNSQKYDAEDELYCTPYGCYTYKKAGAKDVPEYSGNFGFVGGAKKGENPFQKISADKAVPGDVGILYEYEVNDYRDESKGMSLRPHHTAILSEKTDDPQLIKAYSAVEGERLNFVEGELKAEDIKDEAGDTKKGRWDYYRYIGQTPRMQRNLSDSKHNQKQADLVSKALQKQAELSANMPKTEYISMIDRRKASKIESENNSQDIVKSFETIPEVKKSNKQKVEQAANSVKGKIETAKQRKARVNAVRKKARAQTKAVRKGQ